MTMYTTKCRRCGLIQAQASTCKSCGAAMTEESAPRREDRFAPAKPRASFSFSGSAALAEDWNSNPHEDAADKTRRLYFLGSAGTLFGIHLVNILLTLCTVGIYSFWAKVKVRSYLLSQSEFEGDRFAYHGTGKELLLGTLKAALVFGLPVMLLQNVPMLLGAEMWIQIVALVLVYVILMIFIPFAIVGTRRYRLSRTSWRGVRFSFRGSAKEFIKLFIGGGLLTILTLGFYVPYFSVKQYAFLTSHSYFGNQKFHFEGSGREIFSAYVIALLLTIPTLGLSWFWYGARKQRYLLGQTSFGAARFDCGVTGGALCILTLTNFVLLLATLGLASALATVRNIRFWFDRVSLKGPLDMAAIQQEAQSATATAEGLAGFLDLDFDLGL
jgi:uncharacterized membrane protein YjgN (DUF898 family)